MKELKRCIREKIDFVSLRKASFENKCTNGEYVFGQVPFGYEKSKDVKNAVVINEKEAAIVRYIFSLAMQGKSSIQMVKCILGVKILLEEC